MGELDIYSKIYKGPVPVADLMENCLLWASHLLRPRCGIGWRAK